CTSSMIQPSSRSCSTAKAVTSCNRALGITTAPSWSATMTSSGNTATPPQPMGCCQSAKVRAATDGGAAAPLAQTGSPVERTPARSRTAPSLTRAATPRLAMRAQRISPQNPASLMPLASTTAIHPAGICSMAARVDRGELHDSGVARSSRAGTNRTVKARPTMRCAPAVSGMAPRIHTLRRPFLSSTVVKVAVVTPASAWNADASWDEVMCGLLSARRTEATQVAKSYTTAPAVPLPAPGHTALFDLHIFYNICAVHTRRPTMTALRHIKPSPDAVLAKAVLRAADQLGLRQADLAAVLGVHRTAISRLKQNPSLDPASKQGELAVLLLRLARALYTLAGGDPDWIRHFMHTPNRVTGGIPARQIESIQGLMTVLQFTDAIRGKT